MRRALLKNVSLYARTFYNSPQIPPYQTLNLIPNFNLPIPHRSFSDQSNSSHQNPNPNPNPNPPPPVEETTLQHKDADFLLEDVSTHELKTRIVKYLDGDEEALPSVLDAVLSRKLSGKHEASDDELTQQLHFAPLDTVDDVDFDNDLDQVVETEEDTDEDISNLCDEQDGLAKKLLQYENFNVDDSKWNAIVDEAKQQGLVDDPTECEEILEDMLYWDKLLPEDIKQKVQAKHDELAEKMEKNELEVEEAYEQFKVFADEIVAEHIKKDEEERLLPEPDEVAKTVDTKSDDPPGVGPILRWQTRLVLVPGGDAWHPKNRKVKLSVTVKELGLSKNQFRRMREIVGKRYHSGKDELTITSERFEHREENRKDCLRTLLSIIEEAGKANALVDETTTAYVKQRLKANPAFMARLYAKTKQAATAIPAK